MDDINNSKKSGRFRFEPPGQNRQPAKPSQPKTARQTPNLSEPVVQQGFRDLYNPAKPQNIKKSKPKRFPVKKFSVSLLVILFLAGSGAGAWYIKKSDVSKPAATSSQPTQEPAAPMQNLAGNFRILATGDIITHDSVNQNAKKSDGSYDFTSMLTELKPILENSRARICHNTVPAAGGNISGYPSFNAPKELIGDLSANGCNILSLASDHINDKGQAGIDATLAAIEKDKNIVVSAGANKSAEDQAKEKYFNIGDGQIKFAYFSYTARQNKPISNSFGVNVYESAKAQSQIKKVRSTADLVIVSMCWGKEDSGDIQPEQNKIAQELTDAGVDIIFGHCPHVLQPVKKLKSKADARESIVYYSLGNTLNTQLPLETLIGGLAVINFDMGTKKITDFGFMPTYMHYEWSAADKAARNLAARKNLKLYPLDKASEALKDSPNNTTVKAQSDKVKKIINQFTAARIFTSDELRAE